MAGLLDSILGDDTTKDDLGQTQADRRMPIWSGLINSGLLMLAGGQKMMPEDRAQYIAKMGGVLGGIPEQMIAQRSALSREQLARQQTVKSQQDVELGKQTLAQNKAKLAEDERMRAYVQSPEFQNSLLSLTPTERSIAIGAANAQKWDVVQKMTDPRRDQGTMKDGYYQKPGSPWIYDMALEKWVHVGSPPTGAPPAPGTPPAVAPPPGAPPPGAPPAVVPPAVAPTPEVPRDASGTAVLPPITAGPLIPSGAVPPPPPPPALTPPPRTSLPMPPPPPPPSIAGAPTGAPSGAGRSAGHRPFPGATSPLNDGSDDGAGEVDPNIQLAQAQLQQQPFRNRVQSPSQVTGAPVAPPTPGAPTLTPQQTQLVTPPAAAPPLTPSDKADVHSVATNAQPPVVGFTNNKPLFPGMNPDALKTLTPARAELVRSIAEYRHKPLAEDTRMASAQGRINRQVMEQVRAYYPGVPASGDTPAIPGYSQVKYQNMAPILKEYSQAGKTGKDMTALDIAAGHTATLDAAGLALKNGPNSTDFNNVIQAARARMGLPEGTSYMTVLNAVSGELTKAITGHVTETEIENWKKGMGWGASPAQIQGFVSAIAHLMKEREDGFKYKYKNDTLTDMPYDMISPRNRERLDKIVARAPKEGASKEGGEKKSGFYADPDGVWRNH